MSSKPITQPLAAHEVNPYAHWHATDIQFALANKMSQAEAWTPQYEALIAINLALNLTQYKPVHHARQSVDLMMEGAIRCSCDDCAEMTKEYEWFLEISEPLATRDMYA